MKGRLRFQAGKEDQNEEDKQKNKKNRVENTGNTYLEKEVGGNAKNCKKNVI